MLTKRILIFFSCLAIVAAEKPKTRIFGDFTMSYFTGDEETFSNSALGLSKVTGNKNFTEYDLSFDGESVWNIGRLQLRAHDQFFGDIYTDRNQISRNSSYQNLAEFYGDYFASSQVRLKGKLSLETLEDQSFPEFSNNDSGVSLELEKKIRRNTFIGFGYEVHDLDFDFSRNDNYYQQDAYVNFYRFSPEKNTIKMSYETRSPDSPIQVKKDMFKSGTREMLQQKGQSGVSSLIPEVDLTEPIQRFENYRVHSNMGFELEARIRQRELYNDIEKSFLEGQINGTVNFLMTDTHSFRIDNKYSDRDYSRQDLVENILSYQRNQAEIAHYYSFKRFLFDHRFTTDSMFYKTNPAYDYLDWAFDSSISWDVLRNWNVSFYNAWNQREYEQPRQFFTSNEYSVHSFSTRWKFSSKTAFKTIFDTETRSFKFFENSIDSSYKKRRRDYRFEFNTSSDLGFHLGYKWERETHRNFQVNDRFESLTYIGTRVRL